MKFQMAKNSLFAILLRSPWWLSFAIAAGLFTAAGLWLPGLYAFFIALPFGVIACYVGWQQLGTPSAKRVAATLDPVYALHYE